MLIFRIDLVLYNYFFKFALSSEDFNRTFMELKETTTSYNRKALAVDLTLTKS